MLKMIVGIGALKIENYTDEAVLYTIQDYLLKEILIMKIKEFIEKAKKTNSVNGLKNIITVKNYLPFVEKQELIESVTESCKVVTNGYIQFDEMKKYIVFTTSVIQAYTDLEFSTNYDELIEEYDMLCEHGLLNEIVELFSEEYNATLSMLSMKTDFILKSNSIECQITQFLYGLNNRLDMALGSLSSQVNMFKESITEEDISKLTDLLKTLGN